MSDVFWENLVKILVIVGLFTGLAFLMGGTIAIWKFIMRW